MRHMNILLSKFLRQTLTQGSQCKLSSWKGTCQNVSSCARRGSSKYEYTPLPSCWIDLVLLEFRYDFMSKCECAFNVDLCDESDIFRSYVQERFPNAVGSIIQRSADAILRWRIVGTDAVKRRFDLCVFIRWDREVGHLEGVNQDGIALNYVSYSRQLQNSSIPPL